MKTLSILFLTAFVFSLTACAKENDDGKRTSLTQMNLSAQCLKLKEDIDNAIKAVNACTTSADCQLSPKVQGVSLCLRKIGYNKAKTLSGVTTALKAYGDSCYDENVACTADYQTTSRPCAQGRCASADAYELE